MKGSYVIGSGQIGAKGVIWKGEVTSEEGKIRKTRNFKKREEHSEKRRKFGKREENSKNERKFENGKQIRKRERLWLKSHDAKALQQ